MIVKEFDCRTCGVRLYLDDTRVSKNDKMIPIDSRTGNPHARHQSLASVLRRALALPFEESYGRQCLICKGLYSAIYTDCPDCYDNVEVGYPTLKKDRCFLNPIFGERAIVMWAKSQKKSIPLRLIRQHLSTSIENQR